MKTDVFHFSEQISYLVHFSRHIHYSLFRRNPLLLCYCCLCAVAILCRLIVPPYTSNGIEMETVKILRLRERERERRRVGYQKYSWSIVMFKKVSHFIFILTLPSSPHKQITTIPLRLTTIIALITGWYNANRQCGSGQHVYVRIAWDKWNILISQSFGAWLLFCCASNRSNTILFEPHQQQKRRRKGKETRGEKETRIESFGQTFIFHSLVPHQFFLSIFAATTVVWLSAFVWKIVVSYPRYHHAAI